MLSLVCRESLGSATLADLQRGWLSPIQYEKAFDLGFSTLSSVIFLNKISSNNSDETQH
jgi:hypothetical protein